MMRSDIAVRIRIRLPWTGIPFGVIGVLLGVTACSPGPPDSTPPQICPPAPPGDPSHDGPFAPADQAPLFESGVILPPSSLPCVPVSTGMPQNECNHHGSAVAELPDGTVAAVWYHGEFEKSLDSRIVWSRLPPGAAAWTAPELLFDDPDHSEGNPTLWVREDGTLFVFFVSIFGGGWDETHVRLIQSMDMGMTFSPPVTLRAEYCWNTRHRPVRLQNGELLLPLYHECLALPTFMRSGDDFATWEQQDPLPLLEHAGQIQPALVQGRRGTVVAMTRDGTGKNRIHRMESEDLGRAWTPSSPTLLPNSGTSIDWVQLENGHSVVVFNNDPAARFPLSVALSYDDGRTFAAVRDLNASCDRASCSYAYPSIMRSRKDGTIWVTYTHNRETIGWVHFNEAWLAQGGQSARIHCLVGEECRAGACYRLCSQDADCEAGQGEACRTGVCVLPSVPFRAVESRVPEGCSHRHAAGGASVSGDRSA